MTEKQKNTELFEQHQIEDTPFKATKLDEKWYLTLGKYRLTEELKTKEEVEEAAKDATWWRIMSVMSVMIRENEEIHELKKQVEELQQLLTVKN